MQEKDLVVAAANGDKEAFMELYKRYSKMVYYHCCVSTLDSETARDLFQEIWLKVYVGLRRIRKIEAFKNYLKTIIRNTIIDYFRKYFPHEEIKQEISGNYRDPLLHLNVKEILKSISPQDRYLLFLRFYEDCTIKEIAFILGLSESAVKMRLHRLLKYLRNSL